MTDKVKHELQDVKEGDLCITARGIGAGCAYVGCIYQATRVVGGRKLVWKRKGHTGKMAQLRENVGPEVDDEQFSAIPPLPVFMQVKQNGPVKTKSWLTQHTLKSM